MVGFHLVLSIALRTAASARCKWLFTVPTCNPMAVAISGSSISSTNRRRKTLRCLPGRFSTASHTPRNSSLTIKEVSGESPGRAQTVGHGAYFGCGGTGRFPKLKLPGAGGIANEVGRDPRKPGGYAAVPAKLLPCLVGPQEAILGHGFRQVGIPERQQGVSIYARPVGGAERVYVCKLCNHPVSQGCKLSSVDKLLHCFHRRAFLGSSLRRKTC